MRVSTGTHVYTGVTPSTERIAAFSHQERKSNTVVSAAGMFHDLLKTALPSRGGFKSCEESVALLIFMLVLKVYASCFYFAFKAFRI